MKVALAGWSLVSRFRDKENPLLLLDFPRVAKEEFGIDVIEINNVFMESHEPDYLEKLVKAAELPDWGNFPDEIRYEGIAKMAPYAVAAHVKFRSFNEQGEDPNIDAKRLAGIMRDAGFDGYICIEILDILKAKALLEKYI